MNIRRRMLARHLWELRSADRGYSDAPGFLVSRDPNERITARARAVSLVRAALSAYEQPVGGNSGGFLVSPRNRRAMFSVEELVLAYDEQASRPGRRDWPKYGSGHARH